MFLFSECKENKYEVFLETNAEGAKPHKEITTVKACAEKCNSKKNCIAFDFDRNDPPNEGARCWIHTDPKIVRKSQPAVDHHIRHINDCEAGKSFHSAA